MPDDNDQVEISAATFPQRSIIDGAPGTSNPTTEATQRQDGPNYFRDSENVLFHFIKDVLRHEVANNEAVLHLSTIGQLSRTTQTHATVMHQFLEQPEKPGEVVCRIAFTTDHIFRVTFASSVSQLNDIDDAQSSLPKDSRMITQDLVRQKLGVSEHEDVLILSTSVIEIRVQQRPFNLQAYWRGSKIPFWSQRRTDLFTGDIVPTATVSHEGRHAMFEAFTLKSGEQLYGLGERFDSVNRNGRKVDFVNHDAIGTSNTRTYINVPFFWSSAGFGCFVNHIARTEFDMAVSEQGTVGFGTEEQHLDYFVIPGHSPKDIIARYTQDLTGTAPVLPIWTYGLWLSRNSYQSWDVVDRIVEKCNNLKIPVDTLHLDTFWFKQNWNPDYNFDEKRFAEPEAQMSKYKNDGLHISLWSYNCAPPRNDNEVYMEGLDRGFFATKSADNSELYAFPEGTRGTWTDDATIDFSDSKAADWYAAKMARLVKQGASAIKTDFADCVPPHAHYQNIAGRRFQNLYSLAYTSSVYRAIKSADSDAIIWARPGTAGSQRYPVHWGGDSQCSWSGLQGTLKASLSIGLSGFSYHSHDIGGFIGKPTPELYIRWAQFGLLSSHSRSHGAGDENGREPWFFGDEAVDIFRKFANLKYALLPYIVGQAAVGAPIGLPLVRAMVLEFPDDRACWSCEEQYMFGEWLLMAPILESRDVSSEKQVYLPKGVWYDFWTKERTESVGAWIKVHDTPLDSIPIWVKEGALISVAQPQLRTWNTIGKLDKIELYGVEGRTGSIKHREGPTAFDIDLQTDKITGAKHLVDEHTKLVRF